MEAIMAMLTFPVYLFISLIVTIFICIMIYEDAVARASEYPMLWVICMVLFPLFIMLPIYCIVRERKRICGVCGKKYYPTSTFCPFCGGQVAPSAVAARVTPAYYAAPVPVAPATTFWGYLNEGDRIASKVSSAEISDYYPALSLYAKAFEAGGDKTLILCKYAAILEKCGDIENAFNKYLEAYRINKEAVSWRKLQELANILGVKVDL